MGKHSLALTLHRCGSRVHWSKNHIVDSFACLRDVMCSMAREVWKVRRRRWRCLHLQQVGEHGVWKWKTTSIMQERFPRWGHARKDIVQKNMAGAEMGWCRSVASCSCCVCVCVCAYLFVAWLKFKWRHGNRYASDCGLNISHYACALRARPTKLKSRVNATSDQIANKPSHIVQL